MLYDIVKAEADRRGITIAALEKKAGIGNGVIGGWRTSRPNIDTLVAVADALGVDVSALLRDEK